MYRKLFIVIALFAPAVLFAQKNDIGVVVSLASYSSTTFNDPDAPGSTSTLGFDRGSGVGVSYNRFWTPNISTELGYNLVHSEANAKLPDGTAMKVGDAEFYMWTAMAQWHFRNFGRTMPYVGAGVASIEGNMDVPGFIYDTDTIFFNHDTTWIANAGVAYAVTRIVVLVLDARYVSYAIDEADGEVSDPPVDVNPLIISAGLHWRF